MGSITLDDIRRVIREELANAKIIDTGNAITVDESGFMGNEDAARYLGMSVATLNRFRREGRGPRYTRYGRPYLYKQEDLDAWLAKLQHDVN